MTEAQAREKILFTAGSNKPVQQFHFVHTCCQATWGTPGHDCCRHLDPDDVI